MNRRPMIYTSAPVRAAVKNLRNAFRRPADGLHRLVMDDCEFLHVLAAIEHDRNRTLRAINQGKAVYGDLVGTDSLWHKLQALRAQRMKGGTL